MDFSTIAWNMVNDAESVDDVERAITWVKNNVANNDLFDELMDALSYKRFYLYKEV